MLADFTSGVLTISITVALTPITHLATPPWEKGMMRLSLDNGSIEQALATVNESYWSGDNQAAAFYDQLQQHGALDTFARDDRGRAFLRTLETKMTDISQFFLGDDTQRLKGLRSAIHSADGPFERNSIELPDRTVVAHRGARGLAPESTQLAYELARDLGADYLEGDVQQTKDGVLVIRHDADLKRTTNVAKVYPQRADAPVSAFTFAELQKLDASGWFSNKVPTQRIIRFDDLLDIAEKGDHRPGIYIEFKNNNPSTVRLLIETLRKRGWTKPDGKKRPRVILQSKISDMLALTRQLEPKIPLTFLFNHKRGFSEGLKIADRLGAEIIGPLGTWHAWPWTIGKAHDRGVLVHPYTINSGWRMNWMHTMGADGLFTDHTEIALQKAGRLTEEQADAIIKRHLGG